MNSSVASKIGEELILYRNGDVYTKNKKMVFRIESEDSVNLLFLFKKKGRDFDNLVREVNSKEFEKLKKYYANKKN